MAQTRTYKSRPPAAKAEVQHDEPTPAENLDKEHRAASLKLETAKTIDKLDNLLDRIDACLSVAYIAISSS